MRDIFTQLAAAAARSKIIFKTDPDLTKLKAFAISIHTMSTKTSQILLGLLTMSVIHGYLKRRRRRAALQSWSDPTREIAVITGGSGGIGLEIATHLAAKGVRIAILDLSPPPHGTIQANVKFYQADVTDFEQLTTISQAIEKDMGIVTMLVNNAGVTNNERSIIDFKPERTAQTIKVNLLSHFYTLKLFLPAMIRSGHGHVMTVASAGSFVSAVGMGDYSSTKAGVLSLHETLQTEIDVLYKQRKKVLCSICHPFFIRSAMTSAAFKPDMVEKMIEPSAVAERVVSQLLSGEGGSVYVPGWVSHLAWFRVLPLSIAHHLRVMDSNNLLANLRDYTRPEIS